MGRVHNGHHLHRKRGTLVGTHWLAASAICPIRKDIVWGRSSGDGEVGPHRVSCCRLQSGSSG